MTNKQEQVTQQHFTKPQRWSKEKKSFQSTCVCSVFWATISLSLQQRRRYNKNFFLFTESKSQNRIMNVRQLGFCGGPRNCRRTNMCLYVYIPQSYHHGNRWCRLPVGAQKQEIPPPCPSPPLSASSSLHSPSSVSLPFIFSSSPLSLVNVALTRWSCRCCGDAAN